MEKNAYKLISLLSKQGINKPKDILEQISIILLIKKYEKELEVDFKQLTELKDDKLVEKFLGEYGVLKSLIKLLKNYEKKNHLSAIFSLINFKFNDVSTLKNALKIIFELLKSKEIIDIYSYFFKETLKGNILEIPNNIFKEVLPKEFKNISLNFEVENTTIFDFSKENLNIKFIMTPKIKYSLLILLFQDKDLSQLVSHSKDKQRIINIYQDIIPEKDEEFISFISSNKISWDLLKDKKISKIENLNDSILIFSSKKLNLTTNEKVYKLFLEKINFERRLISLKNKKFKLCNEIVSYIEKKEYFQIYKVEKALKENSLSIKELLKKGGINEDSQN